MGVGFAGGYLSVLSPLSVFRGASEATLFRTVVFFLSMRMIRSARVQLSHVVRLEMQYLCQCSCLFPWF